jgi:peptidoglycan/xylan/chitin deacetylase (PgdA/CDA1 family)
MAMDEARRLCLTFDNLGQARSVFEEKASLPDESAPEVAVAYPNILRLLADLGLNATFFVEGWSAFHFPKVLESILEAGHEIGLHGWIHENFADLSQARALQFINDGTTALRRAGVTPRGFRAPGGARGPYAADIAKELGYVYDSSVEDRFAEACTIDDDGYGGDGLKRLPNGLVNVPWRWSMIDAIHYFISPSGLRELARLAAYWRSVIANIPAGGLLTIICHAHVSGLDEEKLDALRDVLSLAQETGVEILGAHAAVKAFNTASETA